MRQSDRLFGTGLALRRLVVDASMALAKLDAETLEALAVSCRAFGPLAGSAGHGQLAREASEIDGEMKLFARLLDVTRANLLVTRHAEMVTDGCTGYGPGQELLRRPMERQHGNN